MTMSGGMSESITYPVRGIFSLQYISKGEKITIKAHGGLLDIQGVTIATVDEGFKVQKLETWFDPLEMFRQFTPKDVKVNGKPVSEAEGSEGMMAVKALIDQIENKVKVGDNSSTVNVEVDNPHAGDHQRHEHDESRTAATPAREVPPGHPQVEGDSASGGCPLLASGSASQ